MKSSFIHPGCLLLVLILTVVLYFPSLKSPFLSWDDEGHLTQNRHVKSLSLDNIRSIFTSSVNQTYIPLTILSFALEHPFAGDDPLVYRITNLILHLGVTALIYVFALSLGCPGWGAVIAALIFAIHPMHVESVAWITQRKDVLYSFFYLCGLIAYVRYVNDQKRIFLILTIGFGLLSILSKPMALSFPLILLVIDWFLKRKWSVFVLLEKIPVCLLVFSVAWITYAMNMRSVDFLFPQSLLTWVWCFGFYIRQFFIPHDLLVLYQLPKPVSFFNPEFFLTLAGVALLAWLIVRLKNHRIVLFGVLYYFLSIFFLLRFDDHQDLTFVADRFMYLPSAGFCICIGSMIREFYEKRLASAAVRWGLSVCLGITVVFVLKTSSDRVRIWGNEEAMWTQVIEHYPNAVALTQLGNFYLNRGELDKAEEHYAKAMYVNSRYSKPFGNYGLLLTQQGDFSRAAGFLTRAIELERKPSAVLFNNRGYIYLRLGRNQESLADFTRAIAADGHYVPAYLNRATLHKNQKEYQQARRDLDQVLRIEPGNAKASKNIELLQRMMANEKTH